MRTWTHWMSEDACASHAPRSPRTGASVSKESGDVVKQIHEFVKDIWGRKRQERELRDIEIERERFDLEAHKVRTKMQIAQEALEAFGNIPPDVAAELAIRAVNGADKLSALEERGKLELDLGEQPFEPRKPS